MQTQVPHMNLGHAALSLTLAKVQPELRLSSACIVPSTNIAK
jgi:hypothetical protein